MKKNIKTIIAVWYTQVCVNIIGLPIYYKTYFRESSTQWNLKNKLGSRFFGLILTAILLVGCGSVKKSSTETNLKTESEKNTEIDATKFSNSFTLEPMDLSKPILLGKDTIYNTRVIYNNSKEVIKEKSNEVNKSDLKQDIDTKEKDYSEAINIVANKLILMLTIMFLIFLIYSYVKIKTPLI